MSWPDIASTALVLFFIMDPLGNVPIFHAVLGKLDGKRRFLVAARELIFALLVLLAFLYSGQAILDFLGLEKSSLSIAGGVLLFVISLRMIFPRRSATEEIEDEDPFFVPLAVPLVAGPSTIAMLLLLSSQEPERIIEWAAALLIAWGATTVLLRDVAPDMPSMVLAQTPRQFAAEELGGPWVGEMMPELLARKPMPARAARARSRSGTASTPGRAPRGMPSDSSWSRSRVSRLPRWRW